MLLFELIRSQIHKLYDLYKLLSTFSYIRAGASVSTWDSEGKLAVGRVGMHFVENMVTTLTELHVCFCPGQPSAAAPEEVCGGRQRWHSTAQQMWKRHWPGWLYHAVRNKGLCGAVNASVRMVYNFLSAPPKCESATPKVAARQHQPSVIMRAGVECEQERKRQKNGPQRGQGRKEVRRE